MTSLRYPQVNGEVQCPVQNVKHLVKKAQDPYRALMAYRTTPLESGSSPAELLIALESLLFQCSWTLVDITWSSSKRKMLPWKLDKRRILTRAPCKGLSDLSPGDRVWLPDQSWKDSSEQSWHPIVLCSRNPKWWAEEKYTPPEPPTWNMWSRKPRSQPVPDQASSSVRTSNPVQTPTPTTSRRTTGSGREIRLPELFKD